jgi:hypothetical protein
VVSEVVPLVVYKFDGFEFVRFGGDVVSRSFSGLSQPLSKSLYVCGEVVDKTTLDGSDSIVGE